MNAHLRSEILDMARKDQNLRSLLDQSPGDSDLISQLKEVDRQNTIRMIQIVTIYGWPGRSLVGKDGAHAAWLLIQHAGANIAFQRQCLSLMIEADSGEVSLRDIAHLTDRICVLEGEPQLYGTQYTTDSGGHVYLYDIQNRETVDARRAVMALPPLVKDIPVATS